MTTTGLATPRKAASRPPRPPTPGPAHRDPPRVVARRHESFDRVLIWSLALSILLHLLVLLLSPLFVQMQFPPGGNVADSPRTARPFGMEAIVAIPSENAPENPVTVTPDAQTPTPVRATPPPAAANPGPPSTTPATTPPATDPAASGGNADALRPGYSDPRMYVTPTPYVFDRRTDHERYMDSFRARIDAVNDSMGLAAARERDATDWTKTDANGNRWGLSPEGLHLGGITIPRAVLPVPGATGDNASREAAAERERQRQEIQRQEAERARQETQRERIEATREERGSGGTGNP